MLLDTGSGWQTVDAREDGSYLVFSARGNAFRAAMEPVSETGTLWIGGAAGAGVLVLLAGVLVYRKKKKKKTVPKPVQ